MEGFKVDDCVVTILCGETMEMEGTTMSYVCFDDGFVAVAETETDAMAETEIKSWVGVSGCEEDCKSMDMTCGHTLMPEENNFEIT